MYFSLHGTKILSTILHPPTPHLAGILVYTVLKWNLTKETPPTCTKISIRAAFWYPDPPGWCRHILSPCHSSLWIDQYLDSMFLPCFHYHVLKWLWCFMRVYGRSKGSKQVIIIQWFCFIVTCCLRISRNTHRDVLYRSGPICEYWYFSNIANSR